MSKKSDYRFLPKGRWTKFNGQILETGDILLMNNGELCLVDSGYTTGDPSRIESIPESWSWSFENGAINDRYRNKEYDSGFISNTGLLYREKRYGGDKGPMISYLYRLKRKKL